MSIPPAPSTSKKTLFSAIPPQLILILVIFFRKSYFILLTISSGNTFCFEIAPVLSVSLITIFSSFRLSSSLTMIGLISVNLHMKGVLGVGWSLLNLKYLPFDFN